MSNAIPRAAGMTLGLLLVAGCAGGGTLPPPTPVIDTIWSDRLPANAAPRRADWWRAFTDTVLDALVAHAIRASPDLQSAAVKIVQSQAQARLSSGGGAPQIGLTGGVNAVRIPPELAERLQRLDPVIIKDSLTVQASWEPDLWGKQVNAARADRLNALGAQASYEAALVSLLGDLASAYVTLRVLEARLVIAKTTEDVQAQAAALAAIRQREGRTALQDPAQAAANAAQARAQTGTLEAQLHQQRHALALLAGMTEGEIAPVLAAPGRIPVAPAAPDAGIPRDLLRDRPDVRAAEFAARAQFAKLKSARASLYPSFSLSGLLGFSATTIGASTLLDLFTWDKRAVAGGIAFNVPLFDRGRLVAQVRVQDAAVEQALLGYEKAVLAAQRDVLNALVQCDTAQQSIAALSDADEASGIALRIAMARYREGASDHRTLLSAELSDLAIRDARLQADGNVALGYIALNRALGAGPGAADLPDPLSPGIRARMTHRTHWGTLLPPAPPASPVTPESPQ